VSGSQEDMSFLIHNGPRVYESNLLDLSFFMGQSCCTPAPDRCLWLNAPTRTAALCRPILLEDLLLIMLAKLSSAACCQARGRPHSRTW